MEKFSLEEILNIKILDDEKKIICFSDNQDKFMCEIINAFLYEIEDSDGQNKLKLIEFFKKNTNFLSYRSNKIEKLKSLFKNYDIS